MDELKNKVKQFVKNNDESLRRAAVTTARISAVTLTSYLLASTAAAMFVGLVSDGAMKPIKSKVAKVERPNVRKSLNFREARKGVEGRNIFNSSGELPDESEMSAEASETVTEFDENAACTKSKLPVELVGIIYSPNPQVALASVKERGYDVADIYRAGDGILGNEQAVVYAVQEKRVVINNNGTKECLEIKTKKGAGFASAPSRSQETKVKSNEEPTDGLSTIQLESSFVEEALGPGFSKILESGRLVPYNRDGAMVGFKLIGVKGKSLWKKAGLNNGDVITSVNGASMAQPDKGFAFYEALQNEREIRVEYLKKGKDPSNITVEIK